MSGFTLLAAGEMGKVQNLDAPALHLLHVAMFRAGPGAWLAPQKRGVASFLFLLLSFSSFLQLGKVFSGRTRLLFHGLRKAAEKVRAAYRGQDVADQGNTASKEKYFKMIFYSALRIFIEFFGQFMYVQ